MRAIEIAGTIDDQSRLHLDAPVPISGPSRVRVIILVPESSEPSEGEWLKAASTSAAFDFLNDLAEDVYSSSDGKPYHG